VKRFRPPTLHSHTFAHLQTKHKNKNQNANRPQKTPIARQNATKNAKTKKQNNTKQFYVSDGELSCQMYQRSADVGLGVPFNIASYALLTCMMAQVCDLSPGELVHVMGDAHVYQNHVRPIENQLENAPRPFPMLRLNPARREIDAFCPEDIELTGYAPHKKIEMQMAV
jgi:thymidylate synthase